MTVNSKIKQYILTLITITVVCYICRIINITKSANKDIVFESIIVIGIFSLICIFNIIKNSKTKFEYILVITGYLGRLVLLYVDIYLKETITLLGSGDSEGFWACALERYSGNNIIYTRYPIILEKLLKIFGENRLLVQYSNILFWLATVCILYGCFKLINISKKIRLVAIALICFMPQYMMLCSELMRESSIVFLNTTSVYFFLRWYKKKGFINILISAVFVLLSTILHSGAIALLAVYALFYAFYDMKKERIRFSLKSALIIIFGISALIFIYITPLNNIFMSYMPDINSIFHIQNKGFMEGGSDYLRNLEYTKDIFVFIKYTILKFVYFWISPMPWEWRGIGDMTAFAMDSIVHLTIFVLGIVTWIKDKKNRKITGILILLIIAFGLIFSWGVSNAGTAIRHRSKVIGIEVLLVCMCLEWIAGIVNNKKILKYKKFNEV